MLRSRRPPKLILTLFVGLHLVIDMAMPSVPGAFRFLEEESVPGILVPRPGGDDAGPPSSEGLSGQSLQLPRVMATRRLAAERNLNSPGPIGFLHRRNPSPDRSPQSLVEDD